MKSTLKRLIEQNPGGMADRILELERMCEAQDAEIQSLNSKLDYILSGLYVKGLEKQLSEAKAMIAMQAEALKLFVSDSRDYISSGNKRLIDMVNNGEAALSATSETVAAWRAKETEQAEQRGSQAINDTQATALAYEREVKVKALEEAKSKALPEGWQLVPKIPTQAMVQDGRAQYYHTPESHWKAMLAAAPQPGGSNE